VAGPHPPLAAKIDSLQVRVGADLTPRLKLIAILLGTEFLLFSTPAFAFHQAPPFPTCVPTPTYSCEGPMSWLQLTYALLAEFAEGLALCAMAALLLRRNIRLHVPRLPRAFRITLIVGSMVFAAVYFFAVALDFMYLVPLTRKASELIDGNFCFISFGAGPNFSPGTCPPGSALGLIGFLALGAATLMLSLAKSVSKAFKMLTIPSVLVLEVGLLIIDPAKMTLQVTNFVPWAYDGVYFVSNVFVLSVTLYLYFAVILHKRFIPGMPRLTVVMRGHLVRALGIALLLLGLALLWLLPQAALLPGSDNSAEHSYVYIYSQLLMGETLVILSTLILLIPPINHRFDKVLSRSLRLPRPVRDAAVLALVGGTLFFAFWAMIDILGGYNGPGYALTNYPLPSAIYYDLGLDRLHVWDKQGVLGFLSLSAAALGFMTLNARKSIRVAVKDGLTLFVAPVVALFELALWNGAPVDMYWHATSFVAWPLGRFLTIDQFTMMTGAPYIFVWSGEIYLVSNWLVLIISSLLIACAVLYPLVSGERAIEVQGDLGDEGEDGSGYVAIGDAKQFSPVS